MGLIVSTARIAALGVNHQASSLVNALHTGRSYLGVELEAKYCEFIGRRLAGVSRYMRAAA